MSDHLTLAELGIDPADDAGTTWHPRDKAGVRNDDGHLADLGDDEVLEHQAKPEAAEQPDAGVLLEAEDSEHSRAGEV